MPHQMKGKDKGAGAQGKKLKGKKGRESNPSSPLPLLTSSPSRRPTVAVVGAGRLGTALALALTARGYEVAAMVARSPAHARRAAALAGTPRALALGSAQLEKLPPVRLLFITTPDDAVAGVAARLAALGPPRVRGRVVLHTSGRFFGTCSPSAGRARFSQGLDASSGFGERLLERAERSSAGPSSAFEGDRGGGDGGARASCATSAARASPCAARDKPVYHAAAVMTSGHAVRALRRGADRAQAVRACGGARS